jgi:hypothetical protein
MTYFSIRQFLVAAVAFAIALGQSRAQEPSIASPAEVYSRLARLDLLSSERKDELRRIKREFARNGEAGCHFVISKLDEMNWRLRALAGNKNNWENNDLILEQVGEDSFIKGELFSVLADFYRAVNPKLKQEILRALKESYNPISTWNGECAKAEEAFRQIGNDSIDVLLELAHNDNDRVRCRAYDSLNEITEFANDATATNAPRSLPCRVSLTVRNHDLEGGRDGGWRRKTSTLSDSCVRLISNSLARGGSHPPLWGRDSTN